MLGGNTDFRPIFLSLNDAIIRVIFLFVVRVLRYEVPTPDHLFGLLFAEDLLGWSEEAAQGDFTELLLF